MSKWIEHDGKGLPPLPEDTLVHVRFRAGHTDEEVDPWFPKDYAGGLRNWWEHDGSEVDIVAYRVVPQ